MKSLRNILFPAAMLMEEPVKMAVEKEIPKVKQKVASIHPHPGHRFFQLNKATREISEPEFEDIVVDITKPDHVIKKIIIKEGHLYTSALNKKNAEKHFKKMILREKGYPV